MECPMATIVAGCSASGSAPPAPPSSLLLPSLSQAGTATRGGTLLERASLDPARNGMPAAPNTALSSSLPSECALLDDAADADAAAARALASDAFSFLMNCTDASTSRP